MREKKILQPSAIDDVTNGARESVLVILTTCLVGFAKEPEIDTAFSVMYLSYIFHLGFKRVIRVVLFWSLLFRV